MLTLNESNVINIAQSLEPPLRLLAGSIVMIKMRGHTKTNGLDYYAPAMVLNQYMPEGNIEVIVWDASAGTHYNPNYPIRELGVRGDGNEREIYEISSHVQAVLFSPDEQMNMRIEIERMRAEIATQNNLLAEMARTIGKKSHESNPTIDKRPDIK